MSEAVQDTIAFTELPFPLDEYRRRWATVAQRLDEFGVDAVAVTTPTHVRYLTGYNGFGGYFAPFPVILGSSDEPAMVVRHLDELSVRAESCITQIDTYFGHREFVPAWANMLKSLGLDASTIGLELGAWGLPPADVVALTELLPRLRVVDVTKLVPSVWSVKSSAEVDTMRGAMEHARVAMATFYENLREGSTELDVIASIHLALARIGASTPDFMLLFGRRSALPHGLAAPYPLRRGEVAYTELGGWKAGYASALTRTAVIGSNRDAEALHAVAEEANQAALDAIRPGRTTGDVDSACRDVVSRAGRANTFRYRTGYGIGIGWYERGNISLEPGGEDVIASGMTLHVPTILLEEGRFSVGCSETVLVTDTGVEVFSGLPRGMRSL